MFKSYINEMENLIVTSCELQFKFPKILFNFNYSNHIINLRPLSFKIMIMTEKSIGVI